MGAALKRTCRNQRLEINGKAAVKSNANAQGRLAYIDTRLISESALMRLAAMLRFGSNPRCSGASWSVRNSPSASAIVIITALCAVSLTNNRPVSFAAVVFSFMSGDAGIVPGPKRTRLLSPAWRVEPEDTDVVTTADLATLRRDLFQKQSDALVPAVKAGLENCLPGFISACAVGSRYHRTSQTINEHTAEHEKDVQNRLASHDVRMETLENSARVQSRAIAKMHKQLKAALDEIGNDRTQSRNVQLLTTPRHTFLRAHMAVAARIESVQETPEAHKRENELSISGCAFDYHPPQNKYSYKSEIKSKTIRLYQITGVTV